MASIVDSYPALKKVGFIAARKADFRPSTAARPLPDCAFSGGIAVLGLLPAGPPASCLTWKGGRYG